MKKLNSIDFPKSEYRSYFKRLKQGKVIYTTRVANEVGKYKLNKLYNSPFWHIKSLLLPSFY